LRIAIEESPVNKKSFALLVLVALALGVGFVAATVSSVTVYASDNVN
jgi:hypothetical protein